MTNTNELKKSFEANLLDGDEIQQGQMISAVDIWEWLEEELDRQLSRARIEAYDLLYWKYKELNGQSVDMKFAEAYGELKQELKEQE